MKNALLEFNTGQFSNREIAAKYGMSEGILRHRLKMQREGRELVGSGKKFTFTQEEEEEELARCIGTLCRLGFSPTRSDIKDLVKTYVTKHDIETSFKNGRPGKNWLKGFMQILQIFIEKSKHDMRRKKVCNC